MVLLQVFSGIVYGVGCGGPKIQRACVGMWVEALDFLDLFVTFWIKPKSK